MFFSNYSFFYISKYKDLDKGFSQVNIIILNETIAFLLRHLTFILAFPIKEYYAIYSKVFIIKDE